MRTAAQEQRAVKTNVTSIVKIVVKVTEEKVLGASTVNDSNKGPKGHSKTGLYSTSNEIHNVVRMETG